MAFKLKGLIEQRGAVAAKQKALLDKAVAESRGLTTDEQAEDSALEAQHRALTLEINELQEQERHDANLALAAAAGMSTGDNGIAFRDHNGREVRALGPNDSCARAAAAVTGEQVEPFSVGRCIAAALTGRMDTLSDTEQRGMMGGVDTTGGYLLNPTLSGSVLDLARANSVCIKAGAVTIPMDSSELRLARLTSDPVAQWRAEGVKVNSSAPTFGQVILRPVTLAAIIPVSIELVMDSPNAGTVIQNALQNALAAELDRACLVGTGAVEPIGVRNYVGVNSVTSCGYPTAYTKARTALQAILTANYNGPVENLAWITHPRTAATYDAMVDGDGNPYKLSPWIGAPKRLLTTSLSITEGTGADSSDVIGDFSQMVIGLRSAVNIRVLDSGTVTDSAGVEYNAASQLMKLVVAYMRADMCLLRPTWFSVVSGITTS